MIYCITCTLSDIVPTVVNNGLQNIKTEVVHPMNCMMNKSTIPIPVSYITDDYDQVN